MPSDAFLAARAEHLLAIGRLDLLDLASSGEEVDPSTLKGTDYMRYLIAQEESAKTA